ncbi:MAG: hypothetical protein U0893_05285 [Chloroflexota bacterium]
MRGLMRIALALVAFLGATVLEGPPMASAASCFSFQQVDVTTVGDGPSAQTTIAFRVANTCKWAVSYVAFSTQGLGRVAPANGAVYTSPSGAQYRVEYTGNRGNPGFESIKLTPIGEGYANGSDVFSITVTGFQDDYAFKVQGHAGPVTETVRASSGGGE